jgi:uncharacterized protein (DUF1501 family)
MERRTFIKSSLLASTSLLVPQFLQASTSRLSSTTDKKLVIIQLSGGNDGLNTVIPFRSDNYYKLRPNLAQAKASVHGLNDDLGLNKSLTNINRLYQDGMLSIVNGVGYPNPNRSHFRALDIWHSASDANQYINTGWLGRYLDSYCEGLVPAIEVDDTLSLAMKGDVLQGLAVSNPNRFYRTSKDPFFESLGSSTNKENLGDSNLDYLYKTLVDTQSAAGYIYEKSKLYTPKASFPSTALGGKLKQTAQFINARLDTKVYYVEHGGFDTHAGQINTQNRLLGQLDEALAAFIQELKHGDSMDETLVMVFSEFGRRVKENASGGTDHGTANSVFVIGSKLGRPGMVNAYPSLENLDNNGDLIFNTDFREVYATLLEGWLDASSQKILGKSFKNLGFV